MNLKALGIGLGLIVALGACAGLGACAIVTTPVAEVRAVAAAEYDSADIALNTDDYSFDDYESVVEYSSLQTGFGLVADKTYIIGGVRVGYGYRYDAEDYVSASYWITTFSPLVYVFDGSPVNMTFPSRYCCWYAAGVTSGYWHVITAGSKNDSNMNVVPYQYYLNMIDGESLDSSSVLDYGFMDLSYRAPQSMRLSSSLFSWCESLYMPVVRNALVAIVDREVVNKVGVYADYANDVRVEWGQEQYNSGRNYGYNEGLSAVTDDTTAINTLFGTLWNVPMNILNGLTPLAIFNTPIISIIFTLLGIGILFFVLGRLFK